MAVGRDAFIWSNLLVVAAGTPAAQTSPNAYFSDTTEPAGIRFRHVNSASPEKYLVEDYGLRRGAIRLRRGWQAGYLLCQWRDAFRA